MRSPALVAGTVGAIAGLTIVVLGGAVLPAVLIAGAALPLFVLACGGIRRAFGFSFGAVLFGYAVFGRGFSYLGVPPFFVGELVVAMAVGVLVFVRPTSGRRAPGASALWILLAYGAFLLAPDLGPFGIDALRDSVIFSYAIVGLAVARAWTPDTARVVQHAYERLAPIGVALLSVRLVAPLLFDQPFPIVPINGVNLLGVKSGDAAVQLSIFLVYLVLFRGRGIAVWTRAPAFRAIIAQVALVGLLIAMVNNRGGMLAGLTALAVGVALSRRRAAFVAGGAVAVSLLLAVGPLVTDQSVDRRRSFSAEQIAANLLSVVTDDDRSLNNTREWRLEWWGDILRGASTGDVLTGDGFGPNLAFVYGVRRSPDDPLRSPHSALMTAVARGGFLFALVWLLAIAVAAREAVVARRIARRRRGPRSATTEALAGVVLAMIAATFVNGLFDVYLEGPAGGMWFWASCGAAIGIARVTRTPRIPRGAPVVMTSAGAVAGALRRAADGTLLREFLGVPYAAPPLGDLRWRAPEPHQPWAGTRPALTFAPAPPQGPALEPRLPGLAPDHPVDEDCLALNVWTPGLHGARPVLVWIPGGAYLGGATAQPVYDGARLAAEANAVVVSVGYRLGALGFLDPEGDGVANCGLRDQLAALSWVERHAAAFGGDPRNITVMGESAGAGSILHLLASPARAAAPTFRRAIVQSAQPSTLTPEQGRAVADAFARHLGVSRADAELLRSIPVERILDAQERTSAEMLASVGPMAFAPVLDGDVCDTEIVDGIASGRAADIALVIGTTRDELALFSEPDDGTLDDERLVRRAARLLGGDRAAERMLARCRDRLPPSATNVDVWNAVTTEVMMRGPALEVAHAHTASGGTTFVYRFDWAAPELGAAHGIDLPFTFGTADVDGWDRVVGWDRRAEVLGRHWRASWSFFAATGDPSTPLRRWPKHRLGRSRVMVFAPDATGVVEGIDEPAPASTGLRPE